MMIGTDGTGGAGMHYELENFRRAGIAPWEVLRMATSGNAELIGFSETGRLIPGKEADIVFLRENPVQDVRNVRSVEHIVNNGVLYAHEELLDIARGIARQASERMATENPPPPSL